MLWSDVSFVLSKYVLKSYRYVFKTYSHDSKSYSLVSKSYSRALKSYSFIFLSFFFMFISSLFISSPTFATEVTQSASANASVNVAAACSISSSITSTHSATVTNGEYKTDIGNTNFTITCNDNGGYALYAIGYSNDTYGNTVMISDLGSTYDIATGTGSTGTSKWAMKLTAGSNATIQNSFNNYHVVPTDYTKVAQYTPNTTGQYTATVSSTYSTYVSANQPAGTYIGKVKYTVVHPSTAPTPVPPLYDTIASMSKGKNLDLKAVITVPTSNNPATDTSNSGVYEYDASLYGTASDASNDYPIYFYRGILDSDLDVNYSTKYGSNGDGFYYPNYVVLSSSGTPTSTDTCWRIVRTTGSGGVKMIYNGLYGATNTGSCANETTNAQITTIAFSGTSSTPQQIVRVGYTYNNTYAVNTTYNVPIRLVVGSNDNYAINNTNTDIKDYLENTWFSSNLSQYESLLESSAGYCSDRTFYDSSYNLQDETQTSVDTYATSTTLYYFGSGVRNTIEGDYTPTLNCPRDIVDLYTTPDATNGNKQLSKPIALLTADEAALAGNGYSGRTRVSTYSSNYSYSSFLRSGSQFWLLSPYYRYSSGYARVIVIYTDGRLSNTLLPNERGIRPTISLKSGTGFSGGSGTATDPWVVVAP